MHSFFEALPKQLNNLKLNDVNQYSPLVLAYIGDTVYEIYIRTLLVCRGNISVNKLHRQSVQFVRAKAQADTIHRIMENLSGEEKDIVRRGRNARSGTIPKNADIGEYKYATAFECLLGFLYLKKDYNRLVEILEMAVGKAEMNI